MARKEKGLTCTFFIGDKRVESLSKEYLDKMSERLGNAMSIYYTQHIDEYEQLKGV